jgi:hypothetical protein
LADDEENSVISVPPLRAFFLGLACAFAAFVFVTMGAAPPPAIAPDVNTKPAAKIASAAAAAIRVLVMLSSRLEGNPKRMV